MSNGFIRVSCFGVTMSWSRIRVEMPGSSAETDARLGIGESGLDATAEQIHGEFMGSIPHLDEVRQEHQSVISDLSNSVEVSKTMSREIQPVGKILSELGGSMGDREITLPLPTALPEDLVVESMTRDGGALVRLMVPERFGGIVRHFSLADGDSIVGARWSNGKLVLELN
ncbi:MAG: hypothetical protein ACJ0HH_01430 [Candidatus Thalassarchaeum sp.]